jgi:hypothetical protein
MQRMELVKLEHGCLCSGTLWRCIIVDFFVLLDTYIESAFLLKAWISLTLLFMNPR